MGDGLFVWPRHFLKLLNRFVRGIVKNYPHFPKRLIVLRKCGFISPDPRFTKF